MFADDMILVCYLVGPGEKYAYKAMEFAQSYSNHRPGMNHDLLIVHKEGATPMPASWINHAHRVMVEQHSNRGQDIGSLLRVSAEYAYYPQIMWFGSNCRILHDEWLSRFYEWARHPSTGAVGANGSWEAGLSGRPNNPHLRTHCLMVKPRVLNTLGFGAPDTRTDCFEFEHGIESLTNRLLKREMTVIAVGADGKGYAPGQWPQSGTYRSGEQHNLLVADKMTDMYATADSTQREVLAAMAGWKP